MMGHAQDAQVLGDNLDHLRPKDQEFASSMLLQLDSKGSLTDKQWYWIGELAKRSVEPKPKAVHTQIGSLAPILQLFENAKKSALQYPAIVVCWHYVEATEESPKEERSFRLYVAGERAAIPGSVNVIDYETRDWYGRVTENGELEHSRRCQPPEAMIAHLIKFAADPAGEAAKSAKLTGRCCFCKSTLTDPKSTTVGYGPVCAKRYHLDWGQKL